MPTDSGGALAKCGIAVLCDRIVGHPSRQFLWILAREPKLPASTYQQILTLVAERGYDPARLETTPQK